MQPLDGKIFKILILDDNILYRNNLATSLRLQGFPVEFATGGFHVLHILESYNEYSLLIIHEHTHDMPAEEVISLVRTNHDKAILPILFISQDTDINEIRDMIQLGANEYIVKTPNTQPIVEKAKKYQNIFNNS